MSILTQCIDYFLHIDVYLQSLIQTAGLWTYAILFLIVFGETGLVVLPLLPGDSLLFAAGTLAVDSPLNIHYLAILLSIAAISGDALNYAIGYWIGPKIFHQQKSRFFNPRHLQKAHLFYEKYGAKTIIIARFIPIIRRFAPFVAGIAAMRYSHFLVYNIIGGIIWVCLFLYVGFYFGSIPLVKANFSWVVLGIIAVSVLIPALHYLHHRIRKA